MSIASNLENIIARIRRAEQNAQRTANSVQLVAVSKTKPLVVIDDAYTASQKLQVPLCFGENYVQEVSTKIIERPQYDWHFIGPLQSNKVRDVVGKVSLIHSIDRFKIANEVSKEAAKKNLVQPILLQVHTGDETTKHGFTKKELLDSFDNILGLPAIAVVGLMTLPPLNDDMDVSRSYFREVRDLMEQLKSSVTDRMKANSLQILSMGTTGDFEAAILEGATHVRVGTAIFGERERRNAQ